MIERPPGGGLFESLRGLIATAIGLVQTRLELLATEIEEERLRLLSILIYGAAAFLLFAAGLVMLAVFVVVMFWDSYRLLVTGGLASLFLAAGIGAWLLVLRRIREGSRLFSGSIAELAQDRQALHARSEGEI